MGSLDVDSHFSNIPLKEIIKSCTNLLCNNVDITGGINKSDSENPLSLTTQESYFKFNNILYKENNDVTMGLPLAPNMVNIFLLLCEMQWLEQCPNEFKPFFC